MKELLLLGMLLDGKKHGYQLNESFKHSLSLCADLKAATAYYILNKLEKEGYVTQELDRAGKRPERRVYELTDAGRDLFYQLLRENLSEYSRTYYDDDIGLAFMDRLQNEDVQRLLVEKRTKVRAILKLFNDHVDMGPQGGWRHVIWHDIAHLQAELDWLDTVLKELGDSQ